VPLELLDGSESAVDAHDVSRPARPAIDPCRRIRSASVVVDLSCRAETPVREKSYRSESRLEEVCATYLRVRFSQLCFTSLNSQASRLLREPLGERICDCGYRWHGIQGRGSLGDSDALAKTFCPSYNRLRVVFIDIDGSHHVQLAVTSLTRRHILIATSYRQ
jgi:hypothetical protein